MPEEHHTIEDLENTPAGRTLLLTKSLDGLTGVVQTLTNRIEELEKQIGGHGSDLGWATRLALVETKMGWFTAALGAIGTASLAGVWALINHYITK